jgi:hypothetical protein
MTKELDPEVCRWCAYRFNGYCDPCTKEGKYRYFLLKPLSEYDTEPELPSMKDLVDEPSYKRLALILMHLEIRVRRERNGKNNGRG